MKAGLAVVSSPPDGDVVDFDWMSVGGGEGLSLRCAGTALFDN